MEQSRTYVCKECSSPVQPGHKFCGTCGATVPEDILARKVEYFGALETHSFARLLLIRGTDENDGLSFVLNGNGHVVGRGGACHIPFTKDNWLSDKHAQFVYRDEKLVVTDKSELNGIYVRVRGSVPIQPGTRFMCGEQLFEYQGPPADTAAPGTDKTYFFASPKRPIVFRVLQILEGNGTGMVYCAKQSPIQIGRDECDMNFPDDMFMSGAHAKVEQNADGSASLHDLNSRNGTYVRIGSERELKHGDYLFVGHQLLRVEHTA